MRLKYFTIISILSAIVVLSAGISFSQEEIQYKKFKLENASCDVGLFYKKTGPALRIGVSAIATGKGAQFRKWRITEIRLNMEGERIKPDKGEKFYVKEESFWRVPAAILFVAAGIGSDSPGGNKGIARAGMALGMGFLALMATGDLEGYRCTFFLNKETADRIQEGTDAIEIKVEDETLHLKDGIRIGITKNPAPDAAKYDYSKVGKGDLLKLTDELKGRIAAMEVKQKSYKYGVDAEYDTIQREIEGLEAERGMAYKAWLERE